VDCRFEQGPQALAADPFAGVTKHVSIFLPIGTTSANVNLNISKTVNVIFTHGSLLSIAAGRTLSFDGTVEAPLTQIFSGTGSVVFRSASDVNIYPQWWGALGNGVADDTAAIQAALTTSKASSAQRLTFAAGKYKYSRAIELNVSGLTLECQGTGSRWRSAPAPVTLAYTGNDNAVRIVSQPGQHLSDIHIRGCAFDGTGAGAQADGLLLQANAGMGDSVEGITVEDTSFTNFPRHQVHALRTVYDIVFQRTAFHNSGRTADNLVQYEWDGNAGAASQWTFDDCWFAPYTAGKWAFFAGRTDLRPLNAIADVRFLGGTVAAYDGENSASKGANGIWVNGSLTVLGTHFENIPLDQPRTIGIRYTGSSGALIAPSEVSYFGTGVEIGNSGNENGGQPRTRDEAVGAVIMGPVGFNNNCTSPITCSDIHIVGGMGSRRGTWINVNGSFTRSGNFGQSDSLPKILNEAASANDVFTMQLATPAGKPHMGPFYMDLANARLGIGVDPAVALQLRVPANNGLRLENSSNGNRISAQLLQTSDNVGQLLAYDAAQIKRVIINGDGTAAFNTAGEASSDSSAILNLTSTTKGFLPPRLSTAERDAIPSPTPGLMIYNTTVGAWQGYNGAWVTIGR
jgi:hypothetical protein